MSGYSAFVPLLKLQYCEHVGALVPLAHSLEHFSSLPEESSVSNPSHRRDAARVSYLNVMQGKENNYFSARGREAHNSFYSHVAFDEHRFYIIERKSRFIFI